MSEVPNIIEWLSSVSSIVSSVAVLVGLLIAWKQLGVWKRQVMHQKRAEAAETLLATAFEVVDVMKSVRSRLATIPRDEANSKTYILKQRVNQLNAANEIFQSLRMAQIRSKMLFQNNAIDQAVDELFKSRIDFLNNIDLLFEFADDKSADLKPDDRELLIEARRVVYGSCDLNDQLHQKLVKALSELESALGPHIRLDA
jgi:hypothetical protein